MGHNRTQSSVSNHFPFVLVRSSGPFTPIAFDSSAKVEPKSKALDGIRPSSILIPKISVRISDGNGIAAQYLTPASDAFARVCCRRATRSAVCESRKFDREDERIVLFLAQFASAGWQLVKASLPLPPGLSGSRLWNTRFVEAKMAKIPWTPELALVTGVIWGWPSGLGCLIATRAEYLRSFLLEALDFATAQGVSTAGSH
jgi:hypothetical protein